MYRTAGDGAVRPGQIRVFEDAALRCGIGEAGGPTPSASIASSSPGSMSQTKDAPTMSSAAVSEATTHPRSRRPATAAAPVRVPARIQGVLIHEGEQKAPRTVGDSFNAACSKLESAAPWASSAPSMSESVVAAPGARVIIGPASRAGREFRAVDQVAVCPNATPVPAAMFRKTGCASQVVWPVVESRVCRGARHRPPWPPRVCSSGTSLSQPRSWSTGTWIPSATAVQTASWPRCPGASRQWSVVGFAAPSPGPKTRVRHTLGPERSLVVYRATNSHSSAGA